MSEIDPVILKLIADNKTYLAELGNTTRKVDQLLGTQEKRAKRLEAEMKRSSSQIALTLKGLAGSLAGYFTGRELVGLIDNFTRLQNQLRVAGLEGEALAQVQERLFEVANKYGVEVNSLAELYGKASQAAGELGASQAQLLALTETTGQALLITGTSTAQASGAILGLTQALSSGIVRAEEFNQINEGGLRPLLEAAAATDRFGGSVAKLRKAVIDGKVSSQEFYTAILANADLVDGKASKAVLTLSGAFNVLSNSLIEYVGGGASAQGVTGGLASAIQALANNLDVIIPALAVIAVAMGVNMVTSAVAASNAMFALQARMLGAATTAEALKFAFAGLAKSLPLIAISALIAGLVGLSNWSGNAVEVTGRYKDGLADANKITDRASELSLQLAGARGKEREATLRLIEAEKELARQKLLTARADVAAAELALGDAEIRGSRVSQSRGTGSAANVRNRAVRDVNQAWENLRAAKRREAKLKAVVDGSAFDSGAAVGGGGGGDGKPKKDTGPTAAETEARFNTELAQISDQALSAMLSMATSADERAELEGRAVEVARARLLADIKADKHYDETQKQRLIAAVEMLAFEQDAAIETERRRQIEGEAADAAEARFRAGQEALRAQFDLADTETERKTIALKIFDADEAYLRSKLEAVELSDTANDHAKAMARLDLAALNATSAARRDSVTRANETEVERYLRFLNPSVGQINEALDGIKIDGLEELNDGLVDAIMGAKSLGEVFSDVAKSIIADLLRIAIQQQVIQPLANSLFSSSGGGSGGGVAGLFSSLSSIFGRAGGGYVAPGQMYRVNEGASPGNVEGFMSRDGGQIIPLGQMNAARAPANDRGGVSVVRLELSGDIEARIVEVSTGVSVEVVRGAVRPIVDQAVGEVGRRMGRPKL